MEYLILFLFSLTLYSITEKINLILFKQKNNILINLFIFSSFFFIIYLIFAYLFILNVDSRYVAYVITAAITISFLILFKDIKKIILNINFSIFNEHKIILLVLILYSFLILFPVFDEDSLRYHLAIAKKINNGSFYSNTWLDYIIVGGHEFINAFALQLNFEEISGYTNFLYLIFILVANIHIKNKYNIGSGILSIYLIIASPYLTSLLTSQKLFMLPCFIVTYSLAYLYLEKKNIELKILIVLLILNIFCVIIKFTFIPYLGILGLWSLYILKKFKHRMIYVFSGIAFLFLSYLPIYIIKNNIYADPYLVLFSINPENYGWFNDYRNLLSNIRMDQTDNIDNTLLKNFLLPLKLIIPLSLSDITKTLGLGLIFILTIDFKKEKNLKFLLLFFVLAVISIQTFQSRWFLPLLILTSIFANVDRFAYILKILKIGLILLVVLITPLSLLTFFVSIKLLDKKIITNSLLDTNYKIIENINTNYKDELIFSNLNDNYHTDNVIPVYYSQFAVRIDEKFYEKNKDKANYILWDTKDTVSLKYFMENYVNCKNYNEVEKFNYNSRRIYFFKNYRESKLYKLDC